MVGFWGRIKTQFVQNVPEEIAFCEFNCHKQHCTEREWQTNQDVWERLVARD